MLGFKKLLSLVKPDEALPGRAAKMPVPDAHFVSGGRLEPPFPAGTEQMGRASCRERV